MNINSADIASVIFSIYTDYEDIFSEIETEHLSIYKKYNYIIDINNKNSLYKSLYNLLNKKLQVLQSYLNNILAKS